MKVKIPWIHLAINSNSPNLHEALIASGAQSCISTPITPKKLVKALLPNLPKSNLLLDNENPIIPLKILAVDDNDANLKLIKALLQEQVAEVVTATDGKQAVELCMIEKFALIYMDIQMPVMDGITALKTIKEEGLNTETPIVAVTAHALSEEKEKLLDYGFSDYMTKPIDETMLRHIIYEYCDFNLYKALPLETPPIFPINSAENFVDIFDWPIALERAANRSDLAKEMFTGLINSLPETKQNISEAITCQDDLLLKSLIHKLNGACCYSGVPNLANISLQIETSLKQGIYIDDLEPELLEFFEHLDSLLDHADEIIASMK